MTTQTQTKLTIEWEGETEECDLLTHHQLVTEYMRFLEWAETAEGCDWCCGGGDLWAARLRVQRDALGFTSWADFKAASPNFVDPCGEEDDDE